MKLFAKWNSSDTGKAIDAVNRIAKQRKLIKIALEAKTIAARMAAVDKLELQALETLVESYGKILKTNGTLASKERSAEMLTFIHNSTNNKNLKDKIKSL
jgi:RNA-binding protein YhbY